MRLTSLEVIIGAVVELAEDTRKPISFMETAARSYALSVDNEHHASWRLAYHVWEDETAGSVFSAPC